MKHYYYTVVLLFCAAVLFNVACTPEEQIPAAPMAAVQVSIDAATSSSISFTITPDENAVCFFYACVPSKDTASATYTRVPEMNTFVHIVDGLEENMEYAVMAYAENKDKIPGLKVVKTVTTTSLPQIGISEVNPSATSVEFILQAVNAVSYSYAVLPVADTATGELSTKVEQDTDKPKTVSIEGLTPKTAYAVVAQAANSLGETSGRGVYEFATSAIPSVCIDKLDTLFTKADISVSWTDCDTVYYSLYKKGDVAEYFQLEMEEGVTSHIFSYKYLETEEYVFSVYGKNAVGLVSENDSVTFTPVEEVASDRSVTVKNVTPFNANFELIWDNSKYKDCYWYADKFENLANPDTVDWAALIDKVKAIKATGYTKPYNVGLLTFNPERSGKYRAGFVYTGTDGKLVPESAIWKTVQLTQITFGESAASVEIDIISVSFANLRYAVRNAGAAQYILSPILKTADVEKAGGVEEYAYSLFKNTVHPKDVFDEVALYQYLAPETSYTIIAIPVDSEGKYGNVVSAEFVSGVLAFNGKAEMTVAMAEGEPSWGSATFKISEEKDVAKRLVLVNNSKSVAMTETEILNGLKGKINANGFEVDESGLYTVKLTSPSNTANRIQVYFAAMDADYNLSSLTKFEEVKLKEIEFTGTGSVAVNIDNFTKSGSYYTVEFTLTPDDNVAHYYYQIMATASLATKKDEALVKDMTADPAKYKKTAGVFSGSLPDEYNKTTIFQKSTFVIIPVSKSGELCPIVKYEITELQ